MVLGALVGLGFLADTRIWFGRDLLAVLAGCAVVAAVGLADDLRPIAIPYRLAVQSAVAIGVVAVVGGVDRIPAPAPLNVPLGLLASPLAILWLLAMTNFYNFMDGINGLAGGQCIASCVGIAVAGFAPDTTALAVVVIGAALGFLIMNFPVARIFLGDVGSTSIGFLLASVPLAVPHTLRAGAMFAVAAGLALFVLDPIETLVRLVRSGRRLGVAHREHSYQLLTTSPARRKAVTAALVGTGLILALGGALAFRMPAFGWPTLMFGLVAFALERQAVRRFGSDLSPVTAR